MLMWKIKLTVFICFDGVGDQLPPSQSRMLFYLRYVNIILKTKTHINMRKKKKKRCGDTLSLKSTSDQTGTTSPHPNRLPGPYKAESQTSSHYTSSRKKGQRNLQVLQLSLVVGGGEGSYQCPQMTFPIPFISMKVKFPRNTSTGTVD